MSRDDDILVAPCLDPGAPAPLVRLMVDDFDDPSEREVTSEEIHVTFLECGPDRPETPAICFRISVTSARELVRQLEAAVRRREGEKP